MVYKYIDGTLTTGNNDGSDWRLKPGSALRNAGLDIISAASFTSNSLKQNVGAWQGQSKGSEMIYAV